MITGTILVITKTTVGDSHISKGRKGLRRLKTKSKGREAVLLHSYNQSRMFHAIEEKRIS